MATSNLLSNEALRHLDELRGILNPVPTSVHELQAWLSLERATVAVLKATRTLPETPSNTLPSLSNLVENFPRPPPLCPPTGAPPTLDPRPLKRAGSYPLVLFSQEPLPQGPTHSSHAPGSSAVFSLAPSEGISPTPPPPPVRPSVIVNIPPQKVQQLASASGAELVYDTVPYLELNIEEEPASTAATKSNEKPQNEDSSAESASLTEMVPRRGRGRPPKFVPNAEMPIACPTAGCTKRYFTKDGLRRHIINKHANKRD